MTDLWEQPVEIGTPASGGPRCVRNSRDAIASLAHDFPRDCREAGKARKICLDALDGIASAELAAMAFRKAAQEAGILRG